LFGNKKTISLGSSGAGYHGDSSFVFPLCFGWGLDVIRKEAWPFYITISGVRLYWVLEEPKGPKGSGFRLHMFQGGSGFRLQVSRVSVQVFRFRVQGSGFRAQGSGFGVRAQVAGCRFPGFRFRVQGAGSRVQGIGGGSFVPNLWASRGTRVRSLGHL